MLRMEANEDVRAMCLTDFSFAAASRQFVVPLIDAKQDQHVKSKME
jgi:hypothetical protein